MLRVRIRNRYSRPLHLDLFQGRIQPGLRSIERRSRLIELLNRSHALRRELPGALQNNPSVF